MVKRTSKIAYRFAKIYEDGKTVYLLLTPAEIKRGKERNKKGVGKRRK